MTRFAPARKSIPYRSASAVTRIPWLSTQGNIRSGCRHGPSGQLHLLQIAQHLLATLFRKLGIHHLSHPRLCSFRRLDQVAFIPSTLLDSVAPYSVTYKGIDPLCAVVTWATLTGWWPSKTK